MAFYITCNQNVTVFTRSLPSAEPENRLCSCKDVLKFMAQVFSPTKRCAGRKNEDSCAGGAHRQDDNMRWYLGSQVAPVICEPAELQLITCLPFLATTRH